MKGTNDDRILPEVQREPRDAGDRAGHDEERPAGDPGQVRRVRSRDVQDRESFLRLCKAQQRHDYEAP